jgi:hypothetical protein
MDASLNGTANKEANPDSIIESTGTDATVVTVNVTTLAGFADPVAVAETVDFSALAAAGDVTDKTTLVAPVEAVQAAIDPIVP